MFTTRGAKVKFHKWEEHSQSEVGSHKLNSSRIHNHCAQDKIRID